MIVDPLKLKIGDKIKFKSYICGTNHERNVDENFTVYTKLKIGNIYIVREIMKTQVGHICGRANVNNPSLNNEVSAWWGEFEYIDKPLDTRYGIAKFMEKVNKHEI